MSRWRTKGSPAKDVAPARHHEVPADLDRAVGRDTTLRVVRAAAMRTHSSGARSSDYFQPGSYARRVPEAWEVASPDPSLRLDQWVERELNRVGMPVSLCGVVVRMAMITMRDGVDVARRVLLEERCIPEDYHFAIDAILKQIPPLI
jgi:hypothetical protein